MPGNEGKRYKFRSRSYLAKLEKRKGLETNKPKSIEVNADEEPHAVPEDEVPQAS